MSKISPSSWGGGFSTTKTKVARNCLKWIDLVSKIFPSSGGGGGFSTTKTKVARNCLKWIDLVSKKISLGGGGRLFCHKNQSCLKLPEMDRSSVKNFSLILGGGGGFSATKTKVAQNCLKWIDLVSKNFPSSGGGGLFCHKNQSCFKLSEMDRSDVKKFSLIFGGFSATKTKVARNCLKWIDLMSKIFSLILGGGLFCQVTTNVRFNDA